MIHARFSRIRERLLLGYSVPILLSIAAASFVFVEAGKVQQSAKTLQIANQAALDLQKLEVEFFRIQKAARGYFLSYFITKNDDFFDEYKEAVKDFDVVIDRLRQEVDNQEQQALLRQMSGLKSQIDQGYRAAFMMFEQGKREQGLAQWRATVVPKLKETEELSLEFQNIQQKVLDESNRQQRRHLQLLTTVLVASTALATLLAIAIALRIASGLAHKITEVVGFARQISEGDLTIQVAKTHQNDEISQLLNSFGSMTENLKTLIQQVQLLGIRVGTSSVKIAASGKQLESNVTEQVASTQEVVVTAKQIAATSTALVQTMEQVDAMSRKTTIAASASQQDIAQIETTMCQLTEATSSISSKLGVISDKANNINNVIITITKVADQTNLLSLNAAIEAEKAGEYGLGFAVVAREIRRLADQTAVATLDIEEMVKEMQSSVTTGVMEMDKFTQEVAKSVNDVSRISSQIGQVIQQVQALTPQFALVNQGMEAQTQGAQQISKSMEQLSDTSLQTANSLREINASIEQLNQVAQGLRQEISRFRVDSEEPALPVTS